MVESFCQFSRVQLFLVNTVEVDPVLIGLCGFVNFSKGQLIWLRLFQFVKPLVVH